MVLTGEPLLHVIGHDAIGLGDPRLQGCPTRTDAIGLAVDRRDPVCERQKEGQCRALDAECVEQNTGRKNLIEMVDDRDQAFRSVNIAPGRSEPQSASTQRS